MRCYIVTMHVEVTSECTDGSVHGVVRDFVPPHLVSARFEEDMFVFCLCSWDQKMTLFKTLCGLFVSVENVVTHPVQSSGHEVADRHVAFRQYGGIELFRCVGGFQPTAWDPEFQEGVSCAQGKAGLKEIR